MNVVYLDELDLSLGRDNFAKGLHPQVTPNIKPIRIAGVPFPRGVGTSSWSELRVLLDGTMRSFSAQAGVVDDASPDCSATFEAWVDGRRAWQSPLRRGGYPPVPFSVDLRGARELILLVADGETDASGDDVAWGDAKFWLHPGAQGRPRTASMEHSAPKLAPFDPREFPPTTQSPEERAACRTPPLGWNREWFEGGEATQEHYLAVARFLANSCLAAAGYRHVVIDVNQSHSEPENGRRLLPTSRFPSPQTLVKELHAAGLFAGIETSAHQPVGMSLKQEEARQVVAWGFDLVRHRSSLPYDQERATGLPAGERSALYAEPFDRMGRELRAAARKAGRPPLLYGIDTEGAFQSWKWARRVGAQFWSTMPHAIGSWGEATQLGRLQDMIAGHAGPGGWNDAGPLWVPDPDLTPREQVAHMTQRIIWRSPLFINCDPEKIDDFALRVLGNPEALAINQDPLAAPPRMLRPHIYHSQRWIRPLANGDWAVAIINRGPVTVDAPIPLGEQGIPRRVVARDCWRRQDIGEFTYVIGCRVEPHEGILLRLRPAR